MSSNPFDDLAEGDGESDDEGTDETAADARETAADAGSAAGGRPARDAGSDEPDGEPTLQTETTRTDSLDTSMSTDDEDATVDGPSLSNSSPPFPYSEAQQKQMYVRDGLWDEFEDLGFDAELELRRTFDVRNVEQRELDTAVIRLVLERLSAEEIAEAVVEMRGFDPAERD